MLKCAKRFSLCLFILSNASHAHASACKEAKTAAEMTQLNADSSHISVKISPEMNKMLIDLTNKGGFSNVGVTLRSALRILRTAQEEAIHGYTEIGMENKDREQIVFKFDALHGGALSTAGKNLSQQQQQSPGQVSQSVDESGELFYPFDAASVTYLDQIVTSGNFPDRQTAISQSVKLLAALYNRSLAGYTKVVLQDPQRFNHPQLLVNGFTGQEYWEFGQIALVLNKEIPFLNSQP